MSHAGVITADNRIFVTKGWGWEDWIWNYGLYCGKVLFVKQGKRCSWHYHKVKDETFLLTEGEVLIRYCYDLRLMREYETYVAKGDVLAISLLVKDKYKFACEVILRPGGVFHVPPGCPHQFVGLLDSKLIEFSTHHDDADSIRLIKGD